MRPDAQAFDKVLVRTVPRYKQSGLSGDEWRISAEIVFYRKGKVIHRESYRNVQTALVFAASEALRACDNGLGWFASVDEKCDQEGCSEPPVIWYRKLADYCDAGHRSDAREGSNIRQFCAKHAKRGDCALDDADRNYEVVKDGRDQAS